MNEEFAYIKTLINMLFPNISIGYCIKPKKVYNIFISGVCLHGLGQSSARPGPGSFVSASPGFSSV
jgi:hypothetical protein